MQPFSLFLPVFNEEEILVKNTEKLLGELDAFKVPYEVLIGSNGSTDSTVVLGQNLQRRHSQVRFFHLPKKGPGTAFRNALDLMSYDALLCLDMDLSVGLDFVPKAVELLDNYDVVVGSKKLGVENRSLYRRLGSDFFIAYSKWLGLPFDDYSLGAKAYRKSVLQRYSGAIGRGTFYVQYIIYLSFRDGLKLIQIPVYCSDNRSSRFNLFQEGLYKLGCISRLWVTNGSLRGKG